jgi:ribosome biogenesis GTPase
MRLENLGWNGHFQLHFESFRSQGFEPARVSRAHKNNACDLLSERGELAGQVAGNLLHQARSRADLPAVGDWVAVQAVPGEAKALVRAVLPRQTWFRRKQAGGFVREGADGSVEDANSRTEAQVVAANVEVAFLVAALNRDFKPSRLERYLLMARSGGAKPVIILSKADLCDDVPRFVAEAQEAAGGPGVPIYSISALDAQSAQEGAEALRGHLGLGQTGVFLGASGVGKSTLINLLLGEDLLPTGPVRDIDNKGRHTTTWRELIPLPSGGILIDAPGLREVKLWADEEGLGESFPDIRALAEECRYPNCNHFVDPGCALTEAAQSGMLSAERYEKYQRFALEAKGLAQRRAVRAKMLEGRDRQRQSQRAAPVEGRRKGGKPAARQWRYVAEE